MIKTHPFPTHDCVPIPEFERLQYYYGRNLTVADFQVEQQYFLEKLRLHNRCFHGTGIVCGLGVCAVPGENDCDDADGDKRRELKRELKRVRAELEALEARKAEAGQAQEEAQEGQQSYQGKPGKPGKPNKPGEDLEKQIEVLIAKQEYLERALEALPDCFDDGKESALEVTVDCGWALDCLGREIVVRAPVRVDLRKLLSAADLLALRERPHDPCAEDPVGELRICYCEQSTYPSRPMVKDPCDVGDECKYGRRREGYRLEFSLCHLDEDHSCGSCCEPCQNECLVLAHIRIPSGRSLTEEDVDWAPRRAVSVYRPAVITGISWRHGATYSQAGTRQILGTDDPAGGLEIHFSRPVYAEGLQPGAIDVYCEHGGKGLAGVVSRIEGSFVDKPDTGLVSSVKFRDESGETLNSGDRVLIVVRGNFILDECCQPIDGEHVGGLVPQLADYVDKPEPVKTVPLPPCAARPQPWVSGNGRPGATFESWFFVA